MTKWIKVPGPGQFRGDGEWREYVPETVNVDVNGTLAAVDVWDYCERTGYLPVHEGDTPPA